MAEGRALDGYGWPPRDRLLQAMTGDWWTLLKSEWVATGESKA